MREGEGNAYVISDRVITWLVVAWVTAFASLPLAAIWLSQSALDEPRVRS